MAGYLASLHEKVLAKSRYRRLRKRVVSAFGCLAVLCTAYALALPAITASDRVYCGIEEHYHSDSCYEQVSTCGLEESEGGILEGHTHSDACYDAAGVSICGLEEAEDKVIEGHAHGEACYERRVICAQEEHAHDRTCFSNKKADVETRDQWEATLPESDEFTGVWAEDLLAVAESQLGYRESSSNFVVDQVKGYERGYTRYGAWYGDPYGDWCAMFVSFCLNYAGVSADVMPREANCQKWISKLEESETSLWHSASSGYRPCVGDLVFFDWDSDGDADHVGIIASAYLGQEKDWSIETIEGNCGNQVARAQYMMDDATILGFGQLPQNSNAVGLLVKTASAPSSRAGSGTELKAYLVGREGVISFSLTDEDNKEPEKDSEGNFIVEPHVSYILAMHASSPNGFEPGSYWYQLPNGLNFANDVGTFVVDGEEIGEWSVSEDGLMSFHFNDAANKKTEVVITAMMGVAFSESESVIEFDGQIVVTIKPPEEEDKDTYLGKWGMQGDGSDTKPDSGKIYWSVQIYGVEGSTIPGSTLTDAITSGNHFYTDSDIAGGLTFGVAETDPATGEQIDWHAWTVYADDPDLKWDQDGWEYKIPNKVRCKYCGDITLGNNGWNYYVEYSSTPDETDVVGSISYLNRVTLDGQEAYGWAGMQHGTSTAGVVKTGVFLGDSQGGRFVWDVTATIPGMKEGEKAEYSWYVTDRMHIKNADGSEIGYVENDMDLARVRVLYNGQTFEVPNIKDATDDDMFAWENSWSDTKDGVPYLREILIHARCACTEETCQFWYEGGCGAKHGYIDADGKWCGPEASAFCRCWAIEGDATFTFSYETSDMEILEEYGGMGNVLENHVILFKKIPDADGNWTYSNAGEASAPVPVPGVFKKELTKDFDGYTANYAITVNEAKLDLTDDSPLLIHDVMSETLAYIAGSLVVTEETADGTTRVLEQGMDYSVTYDGTGSEKDDNGNPVHVLEVEIFSPGASMYTLDYDATLIIPEGATQGVKYSNYASVTLFGRTISSVTEEKIHANINISAKTYRVEVFKTTEEGVLLPGATFGFYNESGGLMASGVTDENGRLLFETNIVQGVILRQHVPYYIQEIDAPDGYVVDDEKHWLCFCDNASGHCVNDPSIPGITRVPGQEIGVIQLSNELARYQLPSTGGLGSAPCVTTGLILLLMGVSIFALREGHRRRGCVDPPPT